MEKKPSNNIFLILVAALLLFTAFLIFPLPKKSRKPIAKLPSMEEDRSSDIVNKHLWMTDQAVELSREQAEINSKFANLKVGESIALPKGKVEPKQMGVDHSADTNEMTAYDDMNRYPKTITATHPDYIIQGQLSDQEQNRQYEAAYREEYVRQFVENARRAGYDVVLNENLVVVSVRPIRTPSSNDLGPQAK